MLSPLNIQSTSTQLEGGFRNSFSGSDEASVSARLGVESSRAGVTLIAGTELGSACVVSSKLVGTPEATVSVT